MICNFINAIITYVRFDAGKLELILEKLSLTNELAQRSNKKMTGIKLAVDGSTEILKEVQAKMAEMAVSKICTATDEIEKRFPMNSIQELELMDHDLSDPEFRKKFVSLLSFNLGLFMTPNSPCLILLLTLYE